MPSSRPQRNASRQALDKIQGQWLPDNEEHSPSPPPPYKPPKKKKRRSSGSVVTTKLLLDIELLMECEEEELSQSQIKAFKWAQEEHEKANNLIKAARAGNTLVPTSQPNTFMVVKPTPPAVAVAPVPKPAVKPSIPMGSPVGNQVIHRPVSSAAITLSKSMPPPRPVELLNRIRNLTAVNQSSKQSADVIVIDDAPPPPRPLPAAMPGTSKIASMVTGSGNSGTAKLNQLYKLGSPSSNTNSQWVVQNYMTQKNQQPQGSKVVESYKQPRASSFHPSPGEFERKKNKAVTKRIKHLIMTGKSRPNRLERKCRRHRKCWSGKWFQGTKSRKKLHRDKCHSKLHSRGIAADGSARRGKRRIFRKPVNRMFVTRRTLQTQGVFQLEHGETGGIRKAHNLEIPEDSDPVIDEKDEEEDDDGRGHLGFLFDDDCEETQYNCLRPCSYHISCNTLQTLECMISEKPMQSPSQTSKPQQQTDEMLKGKAQILPQNLQAASFNWPSYLVSDPSHLSVERHVYSKKGLFRKHNKRAYLKFSASATIAVGSASADLFHEGDINSDYESDELDHVSFNGSVPNYTCTALNEKDTDDYGGEKAKEVPCHLENKENSECVDSNAFYETSEKSKGNFDGSGPGPQAYNDATIETVDEPKHTDDCDHEQEQSDDDVEDDAVAEDSLRCQVNVEPSRKCDKESELCANFDKEKSESCSCEDKCEDSLESRTVEQVLTIENASVISSINHQVEVVQENSDSQKVHEHTQQDFLLINEKKSDVPTEQSETSPVISDQVCLSDNRTAVDWQSSLTISDISHIIILCKQNGLTKMSKCLKIPKTQLLSWCRSYRRGKYTLDKGLSLKDLDGETEMTWLQSYHPVLFEQAEELLRGLPDLRNSDSELHSDSEGDSKLSKSEPQTFVPEPARGNLETECKSSIGLANLTSNPCEVICDSGTPQGVQLELDNEVSTAVCLNENICNYPVIDGSEKISAKTTGLLNKHNEYTTKKEMSAISATEDIPDCPVETEKLKMETNDICSSQGSSSKVEGDQFSILLTCQDDDQRANACDYGDDIDEGKLVIDFSSDNEEVVKDNDQLHSTAEVVSVGKSLTLHEQIQQIEFDHGYTHLRQSDTALKRRPVSSDSSHDELQTPEGKPLDPLAISSEKAGSEMSADNEQSVIESLIENMVSEELDHAGLQIHPESSGLQESTFGENIRISTKEAQYKLAFMSHKIGLHTVSETFNVSMNSIRNFRKMLKYEKANCPIVKRKVLSNDIKNKLTHLALNSSLGEVCKFSGIPLNTLSVWVAKYAGSDLQDYALTAADNEALVEYTKRRNDIVEVNELYNQYIDEAKTVDDVKDMQSVFKLKDYYHVTKTVEHSTTNTDRKKKKGKSVSVSDEKVRKCSTDGHEHEGSQLLLPSEVKEEPKDDGYEIAQRLPKKDLREVGKFEDNKNEHPNKSGPFNEPDAEMVNAGLGDKGSDQSKGQSYSAQGSIPSAGSSRFVYIQQSMPSQTLSSSSGSQNIPLTQIGSQEFILVAPPPNVPIYRAPLQSLLPPRLQKPSQDCSSSQNPVHATQSTSYVARSSTPPQLVSAAQVHTARPVISPPPSPPPSTGIEEVIVIPSHPLATSSVHVKDTLDEVSKVSTDDLNMQNSHSDKPVTTMAPKSLADLNIHLSEKDLETELSLRKTLMALKGRSTSLLQDSRSSAPPNKKALQKETKPSVEPIEIAGKVKSNTSNQQSSCRIQSLIQSVSSRLGSQDSVTLKKTSQSDEKHTDSIFSEAHKRLDLLFVNDMDKRNLETLTKQSNVVEQKAVDSDQEQNSGNEFKSDNDSSSSESEHCESSDEDEESSSAETSDTNDSSNQSDQSVNVESVQVDDDDDDDDDNIDLSEKLKSLLNADIFTSIVGGEEQTSSDSASRKYDPFDLTSKDTSKLKQPNTKTVIEPKQGDKDFGEVATNSNRQYSILPDPKPSSSHNRCQVVYPISVKHKIGKLAELHGVAYLSRMYNINQKTIRRWKTAYANVELPTLQLTLNELKEIERLTKFNMKEVKDDYYQIYIDNPEPETTSPIFSAASLRQESSKSSDTVLIQSTTAAVATKLPDSNTEKTQTEAAVTTLTYSFDLKKSVSPQKEKPNILRRSKPSQPVLRESKKAKEVVHAPLVPLYLVDSESMSDEAKSKLRKEIISEAKSNCKKSAFMPTESESASSDLKITNSVPAATSLEMEVEAKPKEKYNRDSDSSAVFLCPNDGIFKYNIKGITQAKPKHSEDKSTTQAKGTVAQEDDSTLSTNEKQVINTEHSYNLSPESLEAKYSIAFKMAVIKEAQKSGFTNTARWYNIPVTSILKWHDQFVEAPGNLLPEPTSVKSIENSNKEAIVTEVSKSDQDKPHKQNIAPSTSGTETPKSYVNKQRTRMGPNFIKYSESSNFSQATPKPGTSAMPSTYADDLAGDIGTMPRFVKTSGNKNDVEIASTWKQVQSLLQPSKTVKKYSQEYKNKIIKECIEKGQKVVAKDHSIPYNEISRWRLDAKKASAAHKPAANLKQQDSTKKVEVDSSLPDAKLLPSSNKPIKLVIKLSENPEIIPAKQASKPLAKPASKPPAKPASIKVTETVEQKPVIGTQAQPDAMKKKELDQTRRVQDKEVHGKNIIGEPERIDACAEANTDMRMEVINYCFQHGVLKTQKKFSATRQSIIDLMKEYDELNKFSVDAYNRKHGLKTKLVSREKTSVEDVNAETPVVVSNLKDYIVTPEYIESVVQYADRHGVTAATRKFRRKTATVKHWMSQLKKSKRAHTDDGVSSQRGSSGSSAEGRKDLLDRRKMEVGLYAKEFGVYAATKRYKRKAALIKSYMAHYARNIRLAGVQGQIQSDPIMVDSPEKLYVPVESPVKAQKLKTPPKSPIWDQEFIIKRGTNKSPLKLTLSPRSKSSAVNISSAESDEDVNDFGSDDEPADTDGFEVFASWEIGSTVKKTVHDKIVNISDIEVKQEKEKIEEPLKEEEKSVDVAETEKPAEEVKKVSADDAQEQREHKKELIITATDVPNIFEEDDYIQEPDDTSCVEHQDDADTGLIDDQEINLKEVGDNQDKAVDKNTTERNKVVEGGRQYEKEVNKEHNQVVNNTVPSVKVGQEDVELIPYEDTIMFKLMTPEIEELFNDDQPLFQSEQKKSQKPQKEEILQYTVKPKENETASLKKPKRYADFEIMMNLDENCLYKSTRQSKLEMEKMQSESKDDVKQDGTLASVDLSKQMSSVVKDVDLDTELSENDAKPITSDKETVAIPEKDCDAKTTERSLFDFFRLGTDPVKGEINELTQLSVTSMKVSESVETKKEEKCELSDNSHNTRSSAIDQKAPDSNQDLMVKPVSSPDSTSRDLFGNIFKSLKVVVKSTEAINPVEKCMKKDDGKTESPVKEEQGKDRSERNLFDFMFPAALPATSQMKMQSSPEESVIEPKRSKTVSSVEPLKVKPMFKLPKLPLSVSFGNIAKLGILKMKSGAKEKAGVQFEDNQKTDVELQEKSQTSTSSRSPSDLASGIDKVASSIDATLTKTGPDDLAKIADNAGEGKEKENDSVPDKTNKTDASPEAKQSTIVMETFEELRIRLAKERAAAKKEQRTDQEESSSQHFDEIDGSFPRKVVGNLKQTEVNQMEVDEMQSKDIVKQATEDERGKEQVDEYKDAKKQTEDLEQSEKDVKQTEKDVIKTTEESDEDDEMYKDFTPQKVVLILDISKKHGIEFASTSFGLPASVIVNWLIEKDRRQRKCTTNVTLEEKLRAVFDLESKKLCFAKDDTNDLISQWHKEVGWLLKCKGVVEVLDKWKKNEAMEDVQSSTGKENACESDSQKVSKCEEFDKPKTSSSYQTNPPSIQMSASENMSSNLTTSQSIETENNSNENISGDQTFGGEKESLANSEANQDSKVKVPDVLSFVVNLNPRDYSLEQKAMIVLLQDKYGLKEVNKKFGINKGTLWTWKNQNKFVRQYILEQTTGKRQKKQREKSEVGPISGKTLNISPSGSADSAAKLSETQASEGENKRGKPTLKLTIPPPSEEQAAHKGYRLISPTKLPPALQDARKIPTKDFTLEQRVAIVKLVELYGVRTVHKQFRIPSGSIWNWQHNQEILANLPKNETSSAVKRLDFEEESDEPVTIDAILDRALVAVETVNHLKFTSDQKVDMVCLCKYFGKAYVYEKMPQVPRGTVWNWCHNKLLMESVEKRMRKIKSDKSASEELLDRDLIDKTSLTEQWLSTCEPPKNFKRILKLSDTDMPFNAKRFRAGFGTSLDNLSESEFSLGGLEFDVNPSMSSISSTSSNISDFEEIVSEDELHAPSSYRSKKSEVSNQHSQSSKKTPKIAISGSDKVTGDAGDKVTDTADKMVDDAGGKRTAEEEETPQIVYEVKKYEEQEDGRMLVCYVEKPGDLAAAALPDMVMAKSPEQPKKRGPKSRQQQNGNWVPLDEYYYGTQEGIANYEEEKGEYRFKCWYCSKMLYNNVRAMQHIQGHIHSSKQQNIDLNDLTQCKHCYKQFDTPFEMQTHVEKIHLSNKVLMCRICEKEMSSPQELANHMKLNHSACEMPYMCHLCNFRSSMYSDVVDHFKKKHDSSKHLLCLYCLRTFSVKFVSQGWGQTQTYYGHLLKHQSKSSSKKCVVCRLVFFNPLDVKNHRRTCHGSNMRDVQGITGGKYSSQDSVMIKVPETGLPQKKGSQPKSLNAPSISKIQDYGDVRLPRATATSRCVECKMFMNSPHHYKKHINCSMCRFATSCSIAYANHMMGFHSGQMSSLNLNIPWERAMSEAVFCLCGYSTRYGNKMAIHLVACSKKSCMKKKPEILPSTAQEAITSGNEKQEESLLGMLGLVEKKSVTTRIRTASTDKPEAKVADVSKSKKRKLSEESVSEEIIVVDDEVESTKAATDEAVKVVDIPEADKRRSVGRQKASTTQVKEKEKPATVQDSKKQRTDIGEKPIEIDDDDVEIVKPPKVSTITKDVNEIEAVVETKETTAEPRTKSEESDLTAAKEEMETESKGSDEELKTEQVKETEVIKEKLEIEGTEEKEEMETEVKDEEAVKKEAVTEKKEIEAESSDKVEEADGADLEEAKADADVEQRSETAEVKTSDNDEQEGDEKQAEETMDVEMTKSDDKVEEHKGDVEPEAEGTEDQTEEVTKDLAGDETETGMEDIVDKTADEESAARDQKKDEDPQLESQEISEDLQEKSHDSGEKSDDLIEKSHDSQEKSHDSGEKSDDLIEKLNDSQEKSHDEKSPDSAGKSPNLEEKSQEKERSHGSRDRSHDSRESSYDSRDSMSHDSRDSRSHDSRDSRSHDSRDSRSHDSRDRSHDSRDRSHDSRHRDDRSSSSHYRHDNRDRSYNRDNHSRDHHRDNRNRDYNRDNRGRDDYNRDYNRQGGYRGGQQHQGQRGGYRGNQDWNRGDRNYGNRGGYNQRGGYRGGYY